MSWSRRLLVGALLMSTTVAAPMAGEAVMAPGAERCFSVGGRGSAHDIALLNLTPVNASSPGYGYVSYKDPFGALLRSDVSNVNFGPGTVDPNLAVVPIFNPHGQYLDAAGEACFVNSNHGEVDIVVDALGLIASTAFVLPESGAPTRVLDTRIGDGGTRLARSGRVCVHVTGSPGDVALINLTPVLADRAGYGQLVSSDLTIVPVASNVNFAPGTIDPNVAVAPIGTDGRVCFINSSHSSVDVVADHLGSIKRDSIVLPSVFGAPVRVLDTRLPSGQRLGPGTRACFTVAGSPGDAALVNLTPVLATARGYGVLVSSDVTTTPMASNVNFAPGTIDPNVAIAPIGADGRVCYVNSNHATIDLVADHLGSIASASYIRPTPTGVPGRLLDTRPIGETTLTAAAMRIQAVDCFEGGGLCLVAGQTSDGHVTVVRSVDDGRSWSAPNVLSTTGSARHIDCPSLSTCFVVGGTGGSAFMLKSDDAGLAFDTVSTPSAGTSFRDIDCTSGDVCVAVTDLRPSKLLRTSDGGDTWTELFPDVVDVSEIECTTTDDCVIIGRSPVVVTEGAIARSTDGGTTWQTSTGGLGTGYESMHCFDSQRCVFVHTYSFFHIVGRLERTIVGTADGNTAAPAFGGSGDCANPSRCVELAGTASAFTWAAGSPQWTEYDIAAPVEPPATYTLHMVACPLADTCFFAGSRDSGDFVTRVPVQ